MKILIILFLIFWSFNVFLYAQKATMIVHHANVITLDEGNPKAEAIAVQHGKILGVGSNVEILKFKSSNTIVVDALGKTLIPGLYDSHLHVIRAGRFFNTELRWDGVRSLKKALQMLAEQAERTPPGQWVRVVGGWNEYQFEERRLPSLAEINKATGSTPTFILYLYGKAFLNKSGLKALNINGQTQSPAGGLIQKDSDGAPTGLLIAEPSALILYSTLSRLPELTPAEKINSTQLFMSELNRLGVTSVMDAGGGFQNFPDDYKITDSLAGMNKLTVRLPYYLFAQKAGAELQDYRKWTALLDIDHQTGSTLPTEYFVEGGGENLVLSGGDFENFLKPRPELPASMENQLSEVLTVLVKNHWPFRLHATYNESITRFLNVIEAVDKQYPLKDLPWFFDHAEQVSETNLQRIKALGGGLSIQDRMAFQGENFVARYGIEAARNAPPIRKMIDLGIRLGAGTDGTRVSSYNPWLTLYWLTTGKTIGGKELMSADNTVDRLTALKLITQGSASLIKQEQSRGMLRQGYLADFAILNADYLTVPPEQIKTLHSLLTVLNGRMIYGAGQFKNLAPAIPKAIPSWSPVNFYGGYQYE